MALLVAVVVSVGGCVDPQEWVMSDAQIKEQTPYTVVSAGQAWVNAPNITTVLQRNLRGGAEQRISLANRSSIPGDNVILLQTRDRQSGAGRLRFEALVASFEGLPQPFGGLTSGDLVGASDAVGSYLYAVQTAGSGNCILGIRRVDSGMRQLPGDAVVMDIIMRNCIIGSQQDALAPLMAESIGITPVADDGFGSSRMLSPLAAPSGSAISIPIGGVNQ